MVTRTLLTLLLAGLLGAACPTGWAADAPAPRAQFVYVLRVLPPFHAAEAWTDKEKAAVARHFERLATAQGQVILAGKTTEALDVTFGIVVFEAASEQEARAFMQSDPAVLAGLMSATLHPYAVALLRKP